MNQLLNLVKNHSSQTSPSFIQYHEMKCSAYLFSCILIQSRHPLLLRSAAAVAAAASSDVHKQDEDRHIVDVDWAEHSGAIRTIVYTTMHW